MYWDYCGKTGNYIINTSLSIISNTFLIFFAKQTRYYPQKLQNVLKQLKTTILQIDYGAVHANVLIWDKAPKHAWWQQKKKTIMFDC